MVYLQNLTKWSCVSFKPKSSESSFISRRYIEQSTIYVTIRVVCLFPSILLSSFLLFILSSFFPSFPLNYLFVSLSSVYSFPSSALPFTFYHIHVQRTCFCLFPLLCPAWHSFTFRGYKWFFPELANHVERVGTLPLRFQAFTKLLKTTTNITEPKRIEISVGSS